MKKGEIEMKDVRDAERVTRRVQNGVEIVERETIRTISLKPDTDEKITARKMPRLVIGDSLSPRVIITKSRSQLRDIDAFLQNIIRRPLGVK